MKKIYIIPRIKMQYIESEELMDTFSLPKTGNVDDPSVGNAKESTFEDECTPFIRTKSIWDD